jgi:hypothetical protein
VKKLMPSGSASATTPTCALKADARRQEVDILEPRQHGEIGGDRRGDDQTPLIGEE